MSLGLPMMASAAVIAPTAISFTGTATELTGLNLDNENQIIDGSGLSATPTEANIDTVTHAAITFSSPSNGWVTTDPGGVGSDFFASTGDTVIFELTFDQSYVFTDLYSWGYHFGGVNGNDIRDLTIEYGIGDFTGGSTNVTVGLAPSAGAAIQTALGGIEADQMRITVTDNQFGFAGDGGDRVGIAELRFIGDVPTVIPEPSSAALLGLAGLGLLLRRRA